MDGTKRFSPRNEVESVEQFFVERFGEITRSAQRLLTEPGDIPRRNPRFFRLPIDRENSAGAIADQVDNRVRHLSLSAIKLKLSEEDGVESRLQLLLAKWLSKERDIHRRGAVGNGDDHHRLALACAALRRPLHVDQNCCLFAYLKISDLRFLGAIDVAARVMHQHVEYRTNAHLPKRSRFCRANTFEFACRQVGELRQPTTHDLAHSIPKR